MIHETEYDAQKAIFEWADIMSKKCPVLKYLNGSLNGVRLPIGAAMKARRSGMKKGMPDISLPVPRNGYHGLFIELKRKAGGVVSKEQKEWLAFLTAQGYRAVVCNGKSDAIREILEYLRG